MTREVTASNLVKLILETSDGDQWVTGMVEGITCSAATVIVSDDVFPLPGGNALFVSGHGPVVKSRITSVLRNAVVRFGVEFSEPLSPLDHQSQEWILHALCTKDVIPQALVSTDDIRDIRESDLMETERCLPKVVNS